jgi:MoaA/NifB/PqqE/SkfB family radical SAM enzyme
MVRCRAAFGKNRDKLPPLPTPYDDNFVLQLEKYIPHLKEAKFYGGEPFLIPIYYKIWDSIKVLNPNLELFAITNGSHWNKKIESIVTELNFDIAVSIDAIDRHKLETIRKNIVYEKLMENIKRFSAICSRKKKHLSLSFTVQKDNWEQLPLVINLCNEVDAYVYVSYLERPSHFSIADLPKDELKRIRDEMEKVSLPRFTQKERHNDNCFKDFKTYLDKYIANEEEKRYIDYDYQGFESNISVLNELEQKKKVDTTVLATYADFVQFVDSYYSSNTAREEKLAKEELLFKTQQALSLFTVQEQNIIRGLMIQATFDSVIDSVRTSTIEEMEESCRKTLRQIAE